MPDDGVLVGGKPNARELENEPPALALEAVRAGRWSFSIAALLYKGCLPNKTKASCVFCQGDFARTRETAGLPELVRLSTKAWTSGIVHLRCDLETHGRKCGVIGDLCLILCSIVRQGKAVIRPPSTCKEAPVT